MPVEGDIDNISDWLQLNDVDSPDELIRRVGTNVSRMVLTDILKEGSCVLFQLGRKAAHLINRHEIRMKENDIHGCMFLQVLDRIQIRPGYTKGSKIIVFVDTIHKGWELSKLLSYLNSQKEEVSKIYCYLMNEKGVNNLVKAGLIEEGNVVGTYRSFTEDEYNERFRELQAFFRSRIEPMDPDLCFNIYAVNRILELDDIEKIIAPVLKNTFFEPPIKKDSDITGLASNIRELNYAYEPCETLTDICNRAFKTQFNFNIDTILFSFKINQKINSSDLAIWIYPSFHSIPNPCNKIGKIITEEENCYLNIYSFDEKQREDHKKTLCPACVHHCLSNYILDLIENPIKKAFNDVGLECVLIVQSRPV